LELRHLRYIVASARNGSFSAAAHELNVRQPIISKRIKELEEELSGVALFDRCRCRTNTPQKCRLNLPQFSAAGGASSLMFLPMVGREVSVVKIGEIVVILDLHRQGLSVAAIARQSGIARQTVRK
jgi:hypothetical protein